MAAIAEQLNLEQHLDREEDDAPESEDEGEEEDDDDDEDGDDAPPSLFVSRAQDAINFKMVYSTRDLKPDRARRTFKPDLVFQMFGESGTIYGYRNLSINMYYLANSANCFVEIKHNTSRRRPKRPRPDDVLERISSWLPPNYYTIKSEFRSIISQEDHTKIFGTKIDQFNNFHKHEAANYQYVITHCSTSEPGFPEFHMRFESFIVWFIDAASQIDVEDPNWIFIYLYERRPLPKSRRYGYYPVGYCTIYKFFHFPDMIRARIAQVFILPPCQRTGLGIKLLNGAYKLIGELPNVIDITVEDPCEAFTRMRDVLDCKLLMQLEPFKHPNIAQGFTKRMIEEANHHLKLTKRQYRRVYEIIRMAHIMIHVDHSGYQRLYREIKANIEAPFKRESDIVKRKRLVMPRRLCQEVTFVYNPADSERDATNAADLRFRDIKASAQLLTRRM